MRSSKYWSFYAVKLCTWSVQNVRHEGSSLTVHWCTGIKLHCLFYKFFGAFTLRFVKTLSDRGVWIGSWRDHGFARPAWTSNRGANSRKYFGSDRYNLVAIRVPATSSRSAACSSPILTSISTIRFTTSPFPHSDPMQDFTLLLSPCSSYRHKPMSRHLHDPLLCLHPRQSLTKRTDLSFFSPPSSFLSSLFLLLLLSSDWNPMAMAFTSPPKPRKTVNPLLFSH